MEKDIKQHSIAYNKGITNQPSHILADDGELSACNGLTFENGELKPIQYAKRLSDAPGRKILAMHADRYIYTTGGSTIFYGNGYTVMSFSGDYNDIAVVGNTVIVSTTTEMHYALWNGSRYVDLGTSIPEPDVELRLNTLSARYDMVYYEELVNNDGVLSASQQDYNDRIWASIRRMVRKANEDTLFVFPFVARVALELYDGSYLLHSAPHIMLPWYGGDVYLFKCDDWNARGNIHIPTAELMYKINNDNYSDWKDIVKGMTLFISRPYTLFHEDAYYEDKSQDWVHSAIECGYMMDEGVITDIGRGYPYFYDFETEGRPGTWSEVRRVLHKKNDAAILGALSEESNFFKLCDIGLEKTTDFRTTQGRIGSNVLEAIEAQQQLPNEDFHTHDSFVNGSLFAFNGRLHITGAQRKLFEGFSSFFEWRTQATQSYDVVVTVKTKDGEKRVKKSYNNVYEAIGSFYFYYPDSRAIKADIYYAGRLWKSLNLTEHPGLNGAYFMSASLPGYNSDGYAPAPYSYQSSEPEPSLSDSDSIENLQETLLVSEVDNPFLFLPKGFVGIGQSSIMGIAPITMALSEYQHGHLPLVAFTDNGVWSLSIDSEGYYTAMQAVSREVCNNPDSITQVDNGVFFSTDKGLMYVDTSGVKCVSPQMKGTDFDTFIDNCLIAYDYRDSLLHIYSKDRTYNYHYVYNMKTGTFSTDNGTFHNVVNAYPDTLVQFNSGSSWSTYSFLTKPDEQQDEEEDYGGTITTRPMKFGNILNLKSIRHIRHLYAMNPNATVVLTVEASNDAVNWTTLTSLRGKPWKLYRFTITMTNLKATDRYAGTVVWTQERRTEKPR